MDRLKRAAAYALIVTVAYNILLVIASHVRAPALTGALGLVAHGHGFTLGLAAGCLATGEVAILAIIAGAVLLTSWPTDLVALATPLVVGGVIGTLLRNLVRAHHESVPARPDGR